ncbi:hypothetical protein OQA88_2251 [Cercophora sp. LCS_1]
MSQVTPRSHTSQSASSMPLGAIAGIIAITVIGTVILFLLILWLVDKNNNPLNPSPQPQPPIELQPVINNTANMNSFNSAPSIESGQQEQVDSQYPTVNPRDIIKDPSRRKPVNPQYPTIDPNVIIKDPSRRKPVNPANPTPVKKTVRWPFLDGESDNEEEVFPPPRPRDVGGVERGPERSATVVEQQGGEHRAMAGEIITETEA